MPPPAKPRASRGINIKVVGASRVFHAGRKRTCLISLRMLRRRNMRASDFFFKSSYPFLAPRFLCFRVVKAIRVGNTACRCPDI